MAEITITGENFESEVLHSPIPVLLDFWTTWCVPCKMIAPAVAQVAQELEGQVKVGKVNVDEEMDLAVRFGITAIPTLLVFVNGKVTKKAMGAIPKAKILELLK